MERTPDSPPEPMVMAFDASQRDMVRYMGCQRVIEPQLDLHAKCQRLVEYILSDGFSVSGICAEHAAEFRARRPEWVKTLESVGPAPDPYA